MDTICRKSQKMEIFHCNVAKHGQVWKGFALSLYWFKEWERVNWKEFNFYCIFNCGGSINKLLYIYGFYAFCMIFVANRNIAAVNSCAFQFLIDFR